MRRDGHTRAATAANGGDHDRTPLPTLPAIAQTAQPGWIADGRTACRVWNSNPKSGETIALSGACGNGMAQGRGVLQWLKDTKPSDHYEGDYRDGKMNGRGAYVWADRNRYEGEFRDDKAHGSGTKTLADGRVYTGTWTNGCFRQGDRWSTVGTSAKECGFK